MEEHHDVVLGAHQPVIDALRVRAAPDGLGDGRDALAAEPARVHVRRGRRRQLRLRHGHAALHGRQQLCAVSLHGSRLEVPAPGEVVGLNGQFARHGAQLGIVRNAAPRPVGRTGFPLPPGSQLFQGGQASPVQERGRPDAEIGLLRPPLLVEDGFIQELELLVQPGLHPRLARPLAQERGGSGHVAHVVRGILKLALR